MVGIRNYIVAFLTTLALNVNFGASIEAYQYNPFHLSLIKLHRYFSLISLNSAVVFLLLSYFYNNIKSNRTSKRVYLISFVLALFMLIGKIYDGGNSLFSFIFDLTNLIPLIIVWIGFAYLFDQSLRWLYFKIDKIESNNLNFSNFKICAYFEKHLFWTSFFVIFILGLPTLIAFYPGTVQWDGLAQLNSYFGIRFWDNHYPALATMLMGSTFNFGKNLINDNFGIFIYTFTQFVISSLVFSFIIVKIKELTQSTKIALLSLLFYALFPIWPMNAYTYVKDTSYYLAFVLFFFQILRLSMYSTKPKWFTSITMLSTIFFVWMFRNDGFYVLMFVLLLLLIFGRDYLKSRYTALLILFVLFIQILFHSWFLPSMNILEGSVREMMSVPIQQIGRYTLEFRNDLEPSEVNVIEDLYNRSLDEIVSRYNPENADLLKEKFEYNPTKEQLKAFYKLWISLFQKNPRVFFEATLNNTYGYFYPEKIEFKDGIAWYSIEYSAYVFTGDFNLHFYDSTSWLRNILEEESKILRNLPLVGLFFNVGTYTWIGLFSMIALIDKKGFRYLVFSSPMIAIIGIALLSPVNAYVRYFLPLMVSMPLWIAFVYYHTKQSNLTVKDAYGKIQLTQTLRKGK